MDAKRLALVIALATACGEPTEPSSRGVSTPSKAEPSRRISSGFTNDVGGTVSLAEAKQRLSGLELQKSAPAQLVEILESSRADDGQLNVEQFARRIEMHLERQQLKRDLDAQHPDAPGVPKQPPFGFSSGDAEAGADEMLMLVERLAQTRLGEEAALERLQAARKRDDGPVDVGRLLAQYPEKTVPGGS